MRTLIAVILASLAIAIPARADDADLIKSVSLPQLEGLPELPADRAEIASIKMLVTTSSEKSQRHVRIGLNHLLGFWDLEAYRHFLIAAKADPDCPMAFWGICVSLASPGPAFKDQRVAAFRRLKALVEAGVGTELEKQIAGSLAALYAEGPKTSGAILTISAETHRAAVLPGVLACMMLRDGYDEFGEAREGQKVALQFMDEQAERHSDVPAVVFYQAALLEQSPNASKGLRLAERLLDVAPNYPPYLYLIGYFRLKTGDYTGAAQALQASVDNYRDYLETQKIPLSLEPNYHRAINLLAIARDLAGDLPAALELAGAWIDLDLTKDAVHHPGAACMLWQNRTLAARLHLSHEDFDAAIAALPSPRHRSDFDDTSLAVPMWHHLRQYAEGRRAAAQGDLQLARRFLVEIEKFSAELATHQKLSLDRGSFNEWLRFSQLFLELEDQLRASISEAEGGNSLDSARIWLKAAADKMGTFELLNPPLLSRPPQLDWAELELSLSQPEAAEEAISNGLKFWPKHPWLLKLRQAPDPAPVAP